MRALIAFLPRNSAAYGLQADVDLRLLLMAVALSVITGLMAALAPALQAVRGSAVLSLRERGGTGSGLRLRRAIVTIQIAFTLILVIGTALFVRTLTGLLAKGPGFDTSSLISFGVDPLRSGYSRPEAARLIRRIHEEIHVSPSTKASAVAQFAILDGGSRNYFMTIRGKQRIVTDRVADFNTVSAGFLSTLGARIVAGRNFDESDAVQQGKGGKRVTVVNENFVKRYLGSRNPLGVHVGIGNGPDTGTDMEIIGVVANISYRGVREEGEHAYFPMRTEGDVYEGGNFYIRVHGPPEAAFASIRTILRNADPALPVSYFRTLEEMVNRSLNTERMLAALSGSFGVLALLLSLVGLYGVMSFVVTQRTREIGIRVALGATRLATVWLVVRDALAMIAAGIVIALPCVWALGRLIESQLYDVKPTDPETIAAAILVLGVAALGAALIPARRASAVNPTEALRFE